MRPSLAATQSWFFGQLQPGARRAAGTVRGSKHLSARERVVVYADMYQARLVEALSAEFPRLAKAMGEPRFATFALAYFKAHPSTRPTIQHVGLALPSYLARHTPRGFAFAADLAKLDRATSEVYVAEGIGDGPLVTLDDLRRVSPSAWPTLRFRVTSTLRLLKLGWMFPKEGRPQKRVTNLRLWRKGLDVFQADCAADESRALRAVLRGKSFGEVCVAVGTAERAATLLATWVEEGLIEALE